MKISEEQFQLHYKLYKGYAEKLAELEAKPQSTRAWKKDFNYNYAGVLLHFLFFEQLSSKPDKEDCEILKKVETQWGSYGAWEKDFIATAMACRPAGWAYLCNDERGKLHNVTTDAHDDFVPGLKPLLLLDLYEHSFVLDYKTDKSSYIRDFMKSIDWKLVSTRYEK